MTIKKKRSMGNLLCLRKSLVENRAQASILSKGTPALLLEPLTRAEFLKRTELHGMYHYTDPTCNEMWICLVNERHVTLAESVLVDP